MIKYNANNKEYARYNRRQRNSTRQEGILWHIYLKKCSVRFCRQYRIDDYIIDFYAPSVKLAIEIDGSQHYEDKNIEYDNNRTAVLESFGIKVLRFLNIDIDKHLNDVVLSIENEIAELKNK